MIRSVTVVLACMLLATPAMSQQVAGDRVHTVRPGETLGEISRQYLGSAAQWQRIFEANRDRLANPDRIQVGMELVIPGTTAVATGQQTGAATVVGVQVAGQDLPDQTDLSWEARRALLEASPFQPGAVEDLSRESRTVFFGDGRSEVQAASVILQSESEVPTVPVGAFEAAGWVIRDAEDADRVGEIVGFASAQDQRFGRQTVHPYDEIRVEFTEAVSPVVGDEFMTYEYRREVPGVGLVAVPTGSVRILQVDAGSAMAQVRGEVGRIQIGDALGRMRTFPLEPGVYPSESEAGSQATVLAFQDRKELYLPGDVGFIDIGLADGVQVGDEFVALPTDGGVRSGRDVARFQVLGVREDMATVRIASVTSPGAVRAGMVIVLDREMP
jgi:hypothetical protein